MKANKLAKKTFTPIKELPKLEPEPDYIVKTRPPMWDDWRLNIFRGIKENRLKMEANKIARRKCWETGIAYENCCRDGGMFGHKACKVQYGKFVNCCYHEQQVELDKIRRDTSRHTEWYWLNIYDETGEIGKQKDWVPEESLTGMWAKIGYNMFLGDNKKLEYTGSKSAKEEKEQRLEELRKKQGRDVEYYKDELMQSLKVDEEKAIKLNGKIDFTVY